MADLPGGLPGRCHGRVAPVPAVHQRESHHCHNHNHYDCYYDETHHHHHHDYYYSDNDDHEQEHDNDDNNHAPYDDHDHDCLDHDPDVNCSDVIRAEDNAVHPRRDDDLAPNNRTDVQRPWPHDRDNGNVPCGN